MDNNSHNNGSRKEVILYFVIVVLLTFAFNLISGNISHFALPSLRFFGFILLLSVLLAFFPYSILNDITGPKIRQDRKTQTHILALLLVGGSLITFFVSSNILYWMLSFCIFVLGFSRLSRYDIQKYASPVVVGTFLFVVVHIMYLYNSAVYRCITSVSIWVTALVGDSITTPLKLGPSPSGFWIWLYFFMCLSALFLFTRKGDLRKKWKLAILLGGSVALWVLSIIGYGLVFLRQDMYPLSQVTALQLVLFFMLSGLFFVGTRKVSFVSSDTTFTTSPKQIGIFALIMIAAIFLATIPFMNQGTTGKIVFYERNCAIGSQIPEFPEEEELMAADQSISFGVLLWYFEERGYTVEILNEETTKSVRDALEDTAVFIAANLSSPFSADDSDAIKTFVEEGGGLLLFGEHTNMMTDPVDFQYGRHYLNDVLDGTGITINTDTAEWTKNHWQTSTQLFPHPVTKGLTPEDIHTGSVGASLSLKKSAEPIIVGKYAFSDDPNPLEPGFLGNREYEGGELLGEIVLAAADTYGKGRILVFGDTSYGFNEAMPETWKLIENSIDFLTDAQHLPEMAKWITSVFFIGAVGIFLLSHYTTLTGTSAACVILIGALVLSSGLSSLMDTPHTKTDAIAWIDTGHLNLINTRGYKDNSIDGLCKNFMRNNRIPLYLDGISHLEEGSILVIIAPIKNYSSRETAKVLSFVQNGGLLILSAGEPEKDAIKSLLSAFEMDIGATPLGPVPWIIETHGQVPQISQENLDTYWHEPKFIEAYPVGSSSPYTAHASLTYLGQTYNLIVSKQYGRGMVVLIGDSRFLLNENLEYSLDPARLGKPAFAAMWAGNIELLKDIIAKWKEALHE
jgi:hypothetical protein